MKRAARAARFRYREARGTGSNNAGTFAGGGAVSARVGVRSLYSGVHCAGMAVALGRGHDSLRRRLAIRPAVCLHCPLDCVGPVAVLDAQHFRRLREQPAPGRNVVRVVVDDDGPGLTPSERDQVAKRGRRLDETKPGSGLGLSIVVELAGLYGGALHLGTAPIGGLRAELTLPAG